MDIWIVDVIDKIIQNVSRFAFHRSGDYLQMLAH